ncbi:hypothetical protein [Capnocytophaga cynodegmi]|uniref:Uncharacterized protein n=1 Tax=Capnocytophaga cynodegmi TaxID=28189 RepID=A0A0B7HBA5_9FLAO|nr:hypothetical protein [Capnocytophaga cynodegmi]CEN34903.1 conserved hypothetical protein [Capnocytophaga cynodegmi]CEN40564.1 conserved hypothetical protein [Capnocytophaga cynodegmi]
MTSSVIYSRLNVKMKSGDTAFSEDISLEKGTCVGVVFIPFKKQEPEFAVDIEIRLPQGGVLLNPTDYRDYTHKGGGFFNGMKQVNFPTNNNRFFISVNSENQLVNDFNGQLIFAIKREEE